MNLKNKRIIIYVLVILILIISFEIYKWYKYKQSKVIIRDKNIFFIFTDNETNIDNIAKKWLDEYLKQYQQKYISSSYKIKKYEINDIQIIDKDNNLVQMNFKISVIKLNIFTRNWYGKLNSDGTITCSWVVMLRSSENNDGELVADAKMIEDSNEYLNDTKNNIKYTKDKKEKCNYVIRKNKLYVAYDADIDWKPTDWIEVPIDLSTIKKYNSGKTLDDDFYYISPKKTYFITSTSNGSLGHSIVFSDDQGKTWSNIVIPNNDEKVLSVNITDKNNIVAFLGYDFALTDCAIRIIKTTDMKTWQNYAKPPMNYMSQNTTGIFFNDNLGFVKQVNSSGDSSTIYMTYNLGKNYTEIKLPQQILSDNKFNLAWNQVYDMPNLPTYENNILTIMVSQGADGDYDGGKSQAKYISNDLGESWTYVGEIGID